MKKEIYLISGLGADERVFKFLNLSSLEVHYIKWIKPEKDESIQSYSKRLISQIHTPNPILLGVSFGGLIAAEIAKQIPVEKIILISSAKTKFEIPLLYRTIGRLQIDRLIPSFIFKIVNPITYWFFGVITKSEKELLKNIIKETNPEFLKWAIHQIVTWKNEVAINNIYHIHGSKDRILPAHNANILIHGGGHLMIINRSEEISDLLQDFIRSLTSQFIHRIG